MTRKRSMTRALAVVWLGMFLGLSGCWRPAARPGADGGLDGSWKITELIQDGKARPEAAQHGGTFVFDGDKMVVASPGSEEREEVTIQLDATRQPAAIDLIDNEGTRHGIYELNGDKLAIAFYLPASAGPAPSETEPQRPTSFTSTPGSNLQVMKFRRER